LQHNPEDLSQPVLFALGFEANDFARQTWFGDKAAWRGFTFLGSKRVARLRRGVKVVWEDGQHLLRDSARGVEVPLPSTWPKETDAIFDRRYIADPVERQWEILKRYRVERGAWEAT
jgi:hypothetical protein